MAIDKSKCDPELGQKVFQHLKSKGFLKMENGGTYEYEQKREAVQKHIRAILEEMGLNADDEQLFETPKRVGKYWAGEMLAGLNWDWFPKCTMFSTNGMCKDSFLIETGLEVRSVCAHHLANFFGLAGDSKHYAFGPGCTVAYIPNGKMIGISKLGRIVDFLSRRPSNQEELCAIIAETLKFILGTDSVAVYMGCFHTCQTLRGAQSNAKTINACFSGVFEQDDKIRSEFLAIAREH